VEIVISEIDSKVGGSGSMGSMALTSTHLKLPIGKAPPMGGEQFDQKHDEFGSAESMSTGPLAWALAQGGAVDTKTRFPAQRRHAQGLARNAPRPDAVPDQLLLPATAPDSNVGGDRKASTAGFQGRGLNRSSPPRAAH
jgi:hypothetical protein